MGVSFYYMMLTFFPILTIGRSNAVVVIETSKLDGQSSEEIFISFYSLGKAERLRNKNLNFKQIGEDKIYQAQDMLKQLLMLYPHHYLPIKVSHIY